MPDRPARLPPLGEGKLFGPTNMPDRPLHLSPIQQPEAGKGKAPIGGKLFPKKGSSQEDVAVEDTDTPSGRPNLLTSPTVPPPFRMNRPLPSIGQKQPLPQIGGMPRAIPPIGVRSPLPGLTSLASIMPPRRTAPDPFTTGLNASATLGDLSSPARMTPAPLQPLRLPTIRPAPSPTKSPTKVTTVGSLSPASPPVTTKPPEASKPTGEAPTGEQN